MHAELEQPLAQPADLGAGTRRARRAEPEFLHQHIGGGGEEHAELIGSKATAARAAEVRRLLCLYRNRSLHEFSRIKRWLQENRRILECIRTSCRH
jgi:hypothetical protein